MPVEKVGDIKYAKDINFLEDNTENTQKQLDALYGVAKKVGLLINVEKKSTV